ncbi:unnamed protein product [Rhizoctonia solani]|uniref:Bromo domain-containing protein n=1 Tax=Rhizoctonia solani TaxID=456999 RepID=A0A8H2XUT0_9AGAM|nr:unnamed protein product [Rhizoctonia solani]
MSSTSPNHASKRKRVPGVDTSNIIEGESRRAKRPKDGSSVKVSGSASSLGWDDENEDVVVDDAEGGSGGVDEARRSACELGHRLLDTLRKATNDSGTPLATEFKKLPSKRHYPDYFELIKQPIAFDDIRAKLDAHGYASLDQVKADFDLCFRNAKKYNVKNSDIWNAARDLQKKMSAFCNTLQPQIPDGREETPEADDDDDDDFVGSPSKGDSEKRKAGRSPNLNKKYESRLMQLIEKEDNEGNRYSDVFMDLVPKKDYPDYYQIIKKPIAFNPILKRIKQRGYTSPKAFMDDVELVFQNAVRYNEDFSQIWQDAMYLQNMFRTICADWRAEYGYTDENNAPNAVPKLKLKVPAAKAESVTPTLAQTSTSVPTPPTVTQPLQPQSASPAVPNHLNHITRPQVPAVSTPLSTTVAQPAPSYNRPTPPILPPHLRTATPSHLSRSPSVQAPHLPSLKAVDLITFPAGRRIPIHQNGIARLTTWSLRLGVNETSLGLGVQLVSDSTASPVNGNVNGNTNLDPEAVVEIKHNAIAVTPKSGSGSGSEKKTRWDVPLAMGSNALEVRVRGSGQPGHVWRILVERMM